MLASEVIPEEVKTELREVYQRLDPVALFHQLEFYQDSLWQYAWRPSNDEEMKEPLEERSVTATENFMRITPQTSKNGKTR